MLQTARGRRGSIARRAWLPTWIGPAIGDRAVVGGRIEFAVRPSSPPQPVASCVTSPPQPGAGGIQVARSGLSGCDHSPGGPGTGTARALSPEPGPSGSSGRSRPTVRDDLSRSKLPPKPVAPVPPSPHRRPVAVPRDAEPSRYEQDQRRRPSWWARVAARLRGRRVEQRATPRRPAKKPSQGSTRQLHSVRPTLRVPNCPSCGGPIDLNGSCRCS